MYLEPIELRKRVKLWEFERGQHPEGGREEERVQARSRGAGKMVREKQGFVSGPNLVRVCRKEWSEERTRRHSREDRRRGTHGFKADDEKGSLVDKRGGERYVSILPLLWQCWHLRRLDWS